MIRRKMRIDDRFRFRIFRSLGVTGGTFRKAEALTRYLGWQGMWMAMRRVPRDYNLN
jgi:hypothetical protein